MLSEANQPPFILKFYLDGEYFFGAYISQQSDKTRYGFPVLPLHVSSAQKLDHN